MYKGLKVLLVTAAYNEEAKIGKVIERVPPGIVDEVLCMDDGSTDRTAEVARAAGARVVSIGAVKGVGFVARMALAEAQAGGYDVVVAIAGNNKDSPEEIPLLLDPIADEGYDFVMGSRFLAGGAFGGDMPLYRKLATRVHPFLVGLFCGKRITESSNGFRAMRTSILDDERIDLSQSWLDGYEMEVYLLMKILKLGYRTTEVPCTKIYPPKSVGNTKMRPIVDWWNMLRPVFLIGFGLRK